MSIEIPLHDKTGSIINTVLISPEDEELIKKYKWHNSHGYAAGWVEGKKTRMHHLILGKPTKGMVVDHINRNSLDNRRENLRFATKEQNSQNAEKRKNKQYFGICFSKREQKWKSFCQRYSLGNYKNPLDAALVYDKCAYLLFGEHAKTNGLITYEECKNLKLDDLIKTNKHQLPTNIRQKDSKFYVRKQINHQFFHSGGFNTLEEAEKWLENIQPQIDKIKNDLITTPNNIIRNIDGQAIIPCHEIVAIVDDDLWDELSKHSWRGKEGYLCGYVNGKTVTMHQYVMQLKNHDLNQINENNCYIDHINKIRHDNRYQNLRINSTSGNAHNRTKILNTSSGYYGVTFDKSRDKWIAQISKDHTHYFIGRYNTEMEACVAYNKIATELYGEFANLNIIKEDMPQITINVSLANLRKIENKIVTSKYVGVCYDKRRNKWVAQMNKDGKHYFIGRYPNETAAALAYNKKVSELLGDTAKLNVIEVEQPPIDNDFSQPPIDNDLSQPPIDNEPSQIPIDKEPPQPPIDNEQSYPQKLKISIKSHPKIKITLKKKEIKYHGIYYDKRRNKWIARAWNNGKHHYIGQFDNERDAALAYNVKSIELHGEQADLNDI